MKGLRRRRHAPGSRRAFRGWGGGGVARPGLLLSGGARGGGGRGPGRGGAGRGGGAGPAGVGGGAVRERGRVWPMPSASKTVNATADLAVPCSAGPASVTPRCRG